jgi:hypothetical protein
LFFDPAPESQEAGGQFWARRHERTIDVNPPSSPQVGQAQSAALRGGTTMDPVDTMN